MLSIQGGQVVQSRFRSQCEALTPAAGPRFLQPPLRRNKDVQDDKLGRWRLVVAASAAALVAAPGVASSFVTPAARATAFSPAQEQPTDVPAPVVSGALPPWLAGSLVLNGAGDLTGMRHLFDGFACLTRVRLGGGAASASQRYLRSDAYEHFSRTGRLRYREFATPVPAEGPLGRAAAVAQNLAALVSKGRAFTDNASVSLTPLPGGKLLALSEAISAGYVVAAASLATERQVVYGDGVPGDLTTAHPKVAPDGTLVNFSRSLPFGGYHVYVQDPATLERREIAFIRDRDPLSPCWVHDTALGPRHLVIVEPPLFMSLPALITGAEAPYVFTEWRPEAGTRVHVVALDGSGVTTHTAPPLFTFHLGNAFERPSAPSPPASPQAAGGASAPTELCVDFSMYDDPEIVNDLAMPRLRAYPGAALSRSRLARLTIPLTDGAGRPAAATALAPPAALAADPGASGHFFEFPAFNPRYRTLPYRYTYGTAAVRPTNVNNALVKHDTAEGGSTLWHEPGAMPTEPTFVPRPGGAAEDDGVVLSLVAAPGGGSYLLVLDGAGMAEVARVALPFAAPYRFHGAWVAEA